MYLQVSIAVMRRREALQTVGLGIVPVVRSENSNRSDTTTTRLKLGQSYTTSFGETLSINNGTIMSSFLYHLYPDSPRVNGDNDKMYIFVNLDSNLEDKPSNTTRSDYEFLINGTRYDPSKKIGSVPHHRISSVYSNIQPVFSSKDDKLRIPQRNSGGIGTAFQHDDKIHSVGIEYTNPETGAKAIWEFDQDSINRANSEPLFSIEEFTASSEDTTDIKTETNITVKNTGEKGVFRAILGGVDSNHPRGIQEDFEGNETKTMNIHIGGLRRGRKLETGQQQDIRLTTAQGKSAVASINTGDNQ